MSDTDDRPPDTQPPTVQGFSPSLLPQHVQLLVDSAISPEVATARGYASVTDEMQLAALGFSPAQRRVPGLLIPIHDPTGRIALSQYRPDNPRERGGKRVKYETAAGSRMALDVPPQVRTVLADPKVRLLITEGSRKADSAVSHGLACIALLGVWNWRGTNDRGGKTALADFEHVALNGRKVDLAFDHGHTVTVDGEALDEPYAVPPTHGIVPPTRLGAGEYFVMGDNRPQSCDSRVHGALACDDVIGRAIFRHWPPRRMGYLE